MNDIFNRYAIENQANQYQGQMLLTVEWHSFRLLLFPN